MIKKGHISTCLSVVENRQLQFLFCIKTKRVICLEESYPKKFPPCWV